MMRERKTMKETDREEKKKRKKKEGTTPGVAAAAGFVSRSDCLDWKLHPRCTLSLSLSLTGFAACI